MSYQWLIFVSIVGWGIGSLFSKLSTNVMHPIMISGVILVVDAILLPFAFIFFKFDRSLPVNGVLLASAVAVFMTLGTMGYSFALKAGAGAGEATALTAVYPALTLVLSCLFLGEPLTVKKGIGVALAILSCVILGWK